MSFGPELALKFPLAAGEPRVPQLSVGEKISGYTNPFPFGSEKRERRVFLWIGVGSGFHVSAQQLGRCPEAIGNGP